MSLTPQQLEALQHQHAMAASQADVKPIVSFKAGVLELTNNTLTADQRRGQISLYDDDGVYRLEWSLRPNNDRILSLTLIPGSAEFRLINSGTDARVCMLKMNDSGQRHFFWIQEADTNNDISNAKSINDALTGAGQAAASVLNNNSVSQQQFLSMLQNATANSSTTSAPSSTAPTASSATVPQTPAPASQPPVSAANATPAAAQPTPQQPAAQAGSLLARLQAAAAQMSTQQQHTVDSQPTLNDVFDTDRLLPILQADPQLQQLLLQHLPDSQRTVDDLKQQLRSPQFQATLSRLSSILRSEHYGEALQSLSLSPNTSDYGVLGFVEAIQKAHKQSESASNDRPANTKPESNN